MKYLSRNLFIIGTKKIISKKKELHFAVENLSVKNHKEILEIEKIFQIKNITSNISKLGKEKFYINLTQLM